MKQPSGLPEVDDWICIRRAATAFWGRLFSYHMHPFSLGELHSLENEDLLSDPEEGWKIFISGDVESVDIRPLLNFGGFPEPYLRQDKRFHTRWIRSRRELITHEEVRDLTRIEDLDRLEHLVRLLNPRIASPLSINSLREDLGVAFETVRGWILRSNASITYTVYRLTASACSVPSNANRNTIIGIGPK